MNIFEILMVFSVFALAGGVKGVTGMGLPTVAMSLLGLWMSPVHAAALLIFPSLTTNIAQCRGPHIRSLSARLWPGWVAILIVTVTAPGLGSADETFPVKGWLGGILMTYGVWGLWRPKLPDFSTSSKWLSAVVGLMTGFVTALTAIFVLPWVPYLQTLRLDKDEMVQALGLSFTVATLALAIRVQGSIPMGSLSVELLIGLIAALVGAFSGLRLGEMVRGRLAGPAFQKALFLVFIALGIANFSQMH